MKSDSINLRYLERQLIYDLDSDDIYMQIV